jgi:hypothetical protein
MRSDIAGHKCVWALQLTFNYRELVRLGYYTSNWIPGAWGVTEDRRAIELSRGECRLMLWQFQNLEPRIG